MKPKRIILVRHGESEGNADWDKFEHVPDWALNITDRGREQAAGAGEEIRRILGGGSLYVYVSPYYRTRQTFEAIAKQLIQPPLGVREDPRLREQDWGHLRPQDVGNRISEDRDVFGHFYYRIPDGESGADVYDRVSTFLETIHRDFEKEDYPENALIVTHGLTMRLFLMRWAHWSVETFESLRNPRNGQVVVMNKRPEGKYWLAEPLERK